MDKPKWLTQAQWDQLWDLMAAMHNVVVDQADASRQVLRDHQQPLVMFEEVRNAILLV